jgi:hypothetical protein
MVYNDLKRLVERRGITRYKFWKDTGLNRETAYKLIDDPSYIPGKDVMEKIARVYGWTPAQYIDYLPEPETSSVA